MHAAVMARVRESPASRRALFHWAIGVGTTFSHSAQKGPLLRAQHRIADRLVLAPLRNRLTGGRLRFFISGGAAPARGIEGVFWAGRGPGPQGLGQNRKCVG